MAFFVVGLSLLDFLNSARAFVIVGAFAEFCQWGFKAVELRAVLMA